MCLLVDLIFITVLSKWLINSILWHFKINADITILNKSVIIGLPFCVFEVYSVLTYTNDSLTYRLMTTSEQSLLTGPEIFMVVFSYEKEEYSSKKSRDFF